MNITAQQALDAIAAAQQAATNIKVPMNIAVVDRGSNLVAFVKMDGAWLGSKDIAIKKAQTSNYFDMNSGEIGKLSQPGKPLYQIEVSNGGLISFPGGVLIKNDEEIIGAIGVSGGGVEQDEEVAKAGAATIK
ncbi:MAG: heme-binding protein [Rhizobacter sp.]|nr:heme-binding protein [Ferruginibacter sp.]